MNSTPIGARLAWWSADSRIAYFVDIERGEQKAHVVAFDVTSGATRIVFTEAADSYVEVSVDVYTHALIAPLPETNELVWYSERDGNGHLYLYDLVTGAMRNAITAGPWRVREVLSVDAARREVTFLAGGIAPDENPYVRKPCIASLDGAEIRLLSDAPGDHAVHRSGEIALLVKKLEGLDPKAINGMSPSGDYFVETVSSVNDLPRTLLRRRDGSEVALLETASGDLPSGWQAPAPVRCKAADGLTDTYGLLFKPFGYDPNQRYPLIDYIYGGPQTAIVPHASFAAGGMAATAYLEGVHLSSLGAFVLILDGRGTAHREQAFRTASWRAAHTASNLEDHVAAIKQLADIHPEIDLDRVGITGFSGGGYMTAHAALRFGNVFKVAVAGGGNYDQALFWHSWGERYHGAYEAGHYATQAARTYADGLTGKLMLVHGLRDEGCHPAAMFQLVQALIDANKDIDLVVLPRAGHEWTGYGTRRRWDYFVTHLLGDTPPQSDPFRLAYEALFARAAANTTAPVREDGEA
jgi:predicted esterase